MCTCVLCCVYTCFCLFLTTCRRKKHIVELTIHYIYTHTIRFALIILSGFLQIPLECWLRSDKKGDSSRIVRFHNDFSILVVLCRANEAAKEEFYFNYALFFDDGFLKVRENEISDKIKCNLRYRIGFRGLGVEGGMQKEVS